jgi:diguanylate cyclase (GGDEF)-like protein
MVVVAFAAGALTLASFYLPYSFTIRAASVMTVLTCGLSILFGYVVWIKGGNNSDARYFCLAWTSAFAGIGIFAVARFGFLPANFWTNNAGELGVMMLVALLSFALANRLHREKELRITAQESTLQSLKLVKKSQEKLLFAKISANQELENKVAERTQTLQETLLKLEQLSKTDSLTSLYNRGHFEECINTEFKRAIRNERELSVILCDIDNFKAINDTYGHKVGDDCLREVAAVLKKSILRAGDVVARYGGEEFIILLIDTTLKDADKVARSLADGLRALKLNCGKQAIPVTASFGVANVNQTGLQSADQLVHKADIALYKAKNAGRDQVVCWQPE